MKTLLPVIFALFFAIAARAQVPQVFANSTEIVYQGFWATSDSNTFSYVGLRGGLDPNTRTAIGYDHGLRTMRRSLLVWFDTTRVAVTYDQSDRFLYSIKERRADSVWVNSVKHYINYDAAGRITEEGDLYWDQVNQAWGLREYYATYDFDAQGHLLDADYHLVTNTSRDSFIYNSAGMADSNFHYQYYQNAYHLSHLYLYDYAPSGQIAKKTTYFDGGSGLLPALLDSMIYESHDSLLTHVQLQWSYNHWITGSYDAHEYSIAGDDTLTRTYGHDSTYTSYVQGSVYYKKYDGDHNLLLSSNVSPDSTHTVYSQTEATYNAFHAKTSNIFRQLITGVLTDKYITLDSFTADGYLIRETYMDKEYPTTVYDHRFTNYYTAPATAVTEVNQQIQSIAYPNPAADMVYISYRSDAGGAIILKMYDLSGHLVTTTTGKSSPGDDHISYDASRLAPGIYSYELAIPGGMSKGKIAIK
ncbi:MAG: hypothetical protein JWO03_3446 [Bacteroidetes bacterium]|nr:hypothetical protein [Bacteroidota bacterium]